MGVDVYSYIKNDTRLRSLSKENTTAMILESLCLYSQKHDFLIRHIWQLEKRDETMAQFYITGFDVSDLWEPENNYFLLVTQRRKEDNKGGDTELVVIIGGETSCLFSWGFIPSLSNVLDNITKFLGSSNVNNSPDVFCPISV